MVNDFSSESKTGEKNEREHTNITVDLKFSNFHTIRSLVVYVGNLQFLNNLTFAIPKPFTIKLSRNSSQPFFSLKLKTRFCSDLCTRSTGRDLDFLKIPLRNLKYYSFCC